MTDHVLKTGKEDAERLDAIESMFGDASRQFLLVSGLGTMDETYQLLASLQEMPENQPAYYAPGRMAQVAGMV